MTERKLVTHRVIKDIIPIEGADLIELAIVDGWQCVVKKGEFKVGDTGVYFEVDSFLPIKPEYEFLRKGGYKVVEGLGEGFRIRTIKLKGKLSQGLLLPLPPSELPLLGEDLSEAYGVRKYEKPIPAQLQGKVKGNFPDFLRKTDQERVQNLDDISQIAGHTFETTLKLDGSSMTVYIRDGNIGVCSRNLELDMADEGNSFVKTAHTSKAFDALDLFYDITGGEIALQGELMGPGVQGNREDLPSLQFYVFDVWDIEKQEYLPPKGREKLINDLGLLHVPILGETTYDSDVTLEEIQENELTFAEQIPSIKNPIAEGIVQKRSDGKFSFKAINNKFLLSEE
jgi:RNA ligase (TIGR02306 family)